MMKIKEKYTIWKLKTANRVMVFWLDHRVNSRVPTYVLFMVYQLLVKNSYIARHKTSKHHYVPRLLLREFAIKGTGQIFQYTYNKNPERASIDKEAACIENLYSCRDKATKKKSDFLEDQLFAVSLEKYASRVIHRIQKTRDVDLTHLERSIMTSFISFQYVRTPRFLHHVRTVLEFLHLSRGVLIEDMLKRDFAVKAFIQNHYQFTPHEVATFSLGNRRTMTGAEDLILRIAMDLGNNLSEVIYRRNMGLITAQRGAFFYLSDSPADIFNLTKGRSIGPFLWEIKENPLVFMPIAPDMCLYMLKPPIPAAYVIGTILETAIPKSIFQFAYSDRNDPQIATAFDVSIQ